MEKQGSLSLWISEDAIKRWRSPTDPHFIGAPEKYSDDAILYLMTLKVVYGLPYRQLVGFVFSIFSFMRIMLKVPYFTTIAVRARQLGKRFKKLSTKTPTDLVFDSSGLKTYGEGNEQ